MALDGTTIAAIITGILALLGALATAWTSGWYQHRIQARANKKALVRYSVSLIIAAYDLANWFYDILDEDNYSPERCAAYGDGWSSKYTSYLLGQYFASVYILREMIHFFPHIKGKNAELLKRLLWKIQEEFCCVHFDGRESIEMRWFEGDILAVQEHLTEAVEDSEGTTRELRTIGWVQFQKKYAPISGSGSADSSDLYKLFEWYEDGVQRIIYRRFKSLYTNVWPTKTNPQALENLREHLYVDDDDRERVKKLEKEENSIRSEREQYPNISVIVPDHRIRRLQHLLSDLVEVLDAFTAMKLNRPVRRCKMVIENNILNNSNPLDLVTEGSIPCDCGSFYCNPTQEDFYWRMLRRKGRKGRKGLLAWLGPSNAPRRTQVKQENAPLEGGSIVERSKV
jgi:hypothetical protein